MSGIGEAALVLGLISSVITIFEAAQEVYEAADDALGLPKRFRLAAEQIPLVYHALNLAEQNIRTQSIDGQALQSARPVLEACKECATRIKDVFDRTIPAPGASRAERLKKAVGLRMKSKKVKEDMEEVIKSMELLAQHQVFQDAAALQDIQAAIEQLGNLPDEEDQPQFVHSGTGAINANTGSGQQHNYNNAGSGSQYNAQKQFFGRDQVDNQTNVTYHYYLREDRMSLIHNLGHQIDSPHSLSASEKGFLATIGPRRYVDLQERVKGTCIWSTETVQYHSWTRSSRPAILWITGGAGTGKTTLTNYLIEHIKEEPNTYPSDLSLCSFFCSRDIEGQHDVSSVLQDLVLQLIQHNTKVLRQIKSTHGIVKQDYSWSFESVWRMFENAVDLLPLQCIYIMIDALDECDDNLPSRLLQKLAKLLGSMSSSSRATSKRVKLIISGQPRIRTAWSSQGDSVDHYHIDIEDQASIAQDVILFVEAKVAELMRESILSETDGQYLKEVIGPMSENSFLWLTVVFEHIKNSLHFRQARLEDILSQVPRNLQQTYASYLPHIGGDQIPVLQCYLRLFVASSRPLSFAEIESFVLLQDEKALRPTQLTEGDERIVKASIQRALGPLVRFSQCTAQFVHSTAKDFFMLLSQQPVHRLHFTHGTDLARAHLFCFRLCSRYLLHGSIPRDLFDAATGESPSTEVDSPASDRQYPGDDDMLAHLFDLGEVNFLRDEESIEREACHNIRQRLQAYDYAATNWAYHLARCEDVADDDDFNKAIDLLSPALGHLENWYRYLLQQSQLQLPSISDSNPIVLAATFNLIKTIQVLYEASECHRPPRELSSALYWAASRGSIGAVELLLGHGASVSPEQGQRVPLAVATRGNFSEICKCLLAAPKIDPNQADDSGKSALVLAAEADHVEILRLLLSHSSIDVDYFDFDKRTALIAACRNGSTESVRILRKDGRADVNMKDTKGQTPLHHASKTGDLAIIRELFKFPRIDIGAKDNNGRNAMSIAAQEGRLHVVRALHHRGVNAAAVDQDGRSALSWAANSSKATLPIGNEEESVLAYLARKLPHEVDVPDVSGWTPLAWALDSPGYVGSVLTLTQYPLVDINRKDKTFGRCILAWAASAGMIEIVKCLLDKPEIEVDRSSFNGQTALSYAAANGMADTVELLLQLGNALPYQPDHNGRTPADWAERNGFTEIAVILRAISEQID